MSFFRWVWSLFASKPRPPPPQQQQLPLISPQPRPTQWQPAFRTLTQDEMAHVAAIKASSVGGVAAALRTCTWKADVDGWPAISLDFQTELARYNEQNMLELYILIELACLERWHQSFVDTMIGRFFNFLRLHAREYFNHDPVAEVHPIAGPWPNILYVTYWLNFCQVRDLSKLMSIASWFPKYPLESVCVVDLVCNNSKQLNKVSNEWRRAFASFCTNPQTKPKIEMFTWWAQTWLIHSWHNHLMKKKE